MKDISEDLLKKYSDISWGKLNAQNLVHVKYTANIIFLLNFIFLSVDYINLIRGYWTRNPSYQLLFLTHIVLGVSMLAYLLSSKRNQDNAKKNIIYTQIFIFTLLNLTAFISGRVDALLNGEITVFVFTCFYLSFFFYQKPLYTILSYAEAHSSFL